MAEEKKVGTREAPTYIKAVAVIRVIGKMPLAKERTPLMYLEYYVNGSSNMEGPDGPFLRYSGEFLATNLLTGEVFDSVSGVLPRELADEIDATKGDDAFSCCGICTIGVEPSGSGGQNYYVDHDVEPARRRVVDLLAGWDRDRTSGPADEPEAEAEAEVEREGPSERKKAGATA